MFAPMDKNPWQAALGIAVLVAVLGLASWRLLAPWLQGGRCDLSHQVCAVSFDGQELEVELLPRRPSPGEPLRLVLTSTSGTFGGDGGDEEIRVHFSMPGMEMPGMDMGQHVMEPEVVEPGVLEGRITLPSCPMGQSLWQASIRIGQAPVGELLLHVGE